MAPKPGPTLTEIASRISSTRELVLSLRRSHVYLFGEDKGEAVLALDDKRLQALDAQKVALGEALKGLGEMLVEDALLGGSPSEQMDRPQVRRVLQVYGDIGRVQDRYTADVSAMVARLSSA